MKKLKVALLGYGGIGKIHSLAYKNIPIVFPDIHINYLMKYLLRRKKSYSQKNQWLKRISDIDEINEIDLADICTPNFLHYKQSKKLLNKKINVYCEKPLGINYTESKELSELSKRLNLINQVALVYRFLPSIAKTRAFLKKGVLGKVISFQARLLHSSYLNPNRPINWRLEYSKSGGGALIDLGIHLVDTIRFLLGDIKSLEAEVKTVINERYSDSSKTKKEQVNVEDWGLIKLELENGAVGTIEASKVSINPDVNFEIEIYGEKGMIKLTDQTEYDPILYPNKSTDTKKIDKIIENDNYSKYISNIYPSSKMNLGLMVNVHAASQLNLLLNIRNNKIKFKETPTFSEASKAQKIIDYAYTSAKKGGVSVNL